MKYILNGSPNGLVHRRKLGFNAWDIHKTAKMVASVSLEMQHDDRPLLTGPLALDITFFFPPPLTKSVKDRQAMNGTIHTQSPDLFVLVKFIELLCSGIIYKDSSIISRINAQKIYDIYPRTEFSFTRIKS